MQQHDLKPPKGARHNRIRRGRGDSAGKGSYSGRGIKGQKARAGPDIRPNFEGGQLALTKRLSHLRGFTNIFHREFAPVNLDALAGFPAGSEVTPQALLQARLVGRSAKLIKVLGRGEVSVALSVHAHAFSTSARKKIEAAGGTAKEIR